MSIIKSLFLEMSQGICWLARSFLIPYLKIMQIIVKCCMIAIKGEVNYLFLELKKEIK